jgi:hypothetical protein
LCEPTSIERWLALCVSIGQQTLSLAFFVLSTRKGVFSMEQSLFGTRPTVLWTPTDMSECTLLPRLLGCSHKPVITLVGDILTETQEYQPACHRLLEEVVFPLAVRSEAILLSKGFRLGPPHDQDLPWLIDLVASRFPEVPLVGVALDCNAVVPEKVEAESWRTCPLCEHHSAYVLVPGLNERDACAWRTSLASAITAPVSPAGNVQPGVTLVFRGTAMNWFDVLGSIKEGRHVVGLTHLGSLPIGGVSTAIDLLLAGARPPCTFMSDLNRRLDEEAEDAVASGRLASVPATDSLALEEVLTTIFFEP